MPVISPNNTGLSGEYFVAAELYRRGWSVGMTIGNAKAVDLFAEKEDCLVQVQVKINLQKKECRLANDERQRKERLYLYFRKPECRYYGNT